MSCGGSWLAKAHGLRRAILRGSLLSLTCECFFAGDGVKWFLPNLNGLSIRLSIRMLTVNAPTSSSRSCRLARTVRLFESLDGAA